MIETFLLHKTANHEDNLLNCCVNSHVGKGYLAISTLKGQAIFKHRCAEVYTKRKSAQLLHLPDCCLLRPFFIITHGIFSVFEMFPDTYILYRFFFLILWILLIIPAKNMSWNDRERFWDLLGSKLESLLHCLFFCDFGRSLVFSKDSHFNIQSSNE